MPKVKNVYSCEECGATFSKWRGQCSKCSAWNTISDEPVEIAPAQNRHAVASYSGQTAHVQVLSEVTVLEQKRLSTEIGELDRVLGGGMVPGSCVLIGGSPGAGKSTLLLQVACGLAQHHKVLYVSGEESPQQVAARAARLNLPLDLHLLAETRVERILEVAEELGPVLIIIDSIQVVFLEEHRSSPGSVAQVRESAAALTRFAKHTGTILLIVGHVTKDGTLAGPKTLEHIIDASLLLEGSADTRYRTLRSNKNRFGTINELGVFAMRENGLREVTNPCAIFLSRPEGQLSGSAITAFWEGTRSLLVELQALVVPSHLEIPRRVSVGIDSNRIAMLLAILQKHAGVSLGGSDIFVNVVGGVKVQEPGVDLALAASLYSSSADRPIAEDLLIFGEVGLSGEVRPVPYGEERLREAAKHGFKSAIVPLKNIPRKAIGGMRIRGLAHISELTQALL